MIKIYNTLTKKKELLENNNIKIYTCGVTVYDHCHIGHARIFLLFDSLIRYLISEKKNVMFIRNITDLDDKIIKKAKVKNTCTEKLTKYFIKSMHDDTKKLNLIEPTFEPKATSFIKEMIEIISNLKKKKYTYKNKNSSIYFNIANFKKYGQLSKQSIKKLKESYNNTTKKNHPDFVLWKNFKQTDTCFWETEWGIGRPGWHTECAAMTMYYTKDHIDIHGGGQDLLFPHHENELSQCEAVLDKKFIKIWMHIGQIKIKKQKMSKSLGNHISIKHFLKNFNEEHLRFLILSTSYKKNIQFDYEKINIIKKTLNKLYEIKNNLKKENIKINEELQKTFKEALNDNFNTQKAISILFKALAIKNIDKDELYYSVIELFKSIGLLKHKEIKKNAKTSQQLEKIKNLIRIRDHARKNKNWALADKIRYKLFKMNINLMDSHDITTFDSN